MLDESRFYNKDTLMLFRRQRVRWLPADLAERTQIKLRLVYTATTLDDLRIPPSNFLEKLRHNRHGQWSIRINKQWRVCFIWSHGAATRIEVTDYH